MVPLRSTQVIWMKSTLLLRPSSFRVAVNRYALDAVSASLKEDSNTDGSLPSHFALMNTGIIGFESACAWATSEASITDRIRVKRFIRNYHLHKPMSQICCIA